jgi:pimeloyl-ACP methyl ester carboxylesterase
VGNASLSAKTDSFFTVVRGRELEVQRIPGGRSDRPTLVFLHEGLGSISLWRDFPSSVAAKTGCPALVYSRYGHGNSDLLDGPRGVNYMHDEALEVLPELLEKLSIRAPVLLGHSDGGSIALIYAGAYDRVKGLILFAPHVFVEEISVTSIAAAKIAFETTDLPAKMQRHHKDAERTFWGWNNIWLHKDFRSWNIVEYLPRVTCPVLAIQGFADEYGTMAQLEAIKSQTAGSVEIVQLPNCKHSPHRDQPEQVLQAVAAFIERVAHDAPH